MKLTDGTAFGLNPKVKKNSRRSVNETIYPPIYKKKSIKDQFNELTIDFKGGYSLVFRAYEDGAAYRFVSELKKPFMVESEQASFCFRMIRKFCSFTERPNERGQERSFLQFFPKYVSGNCLVCMG